MGIFKKAHTKRYLSALIAALKPHSTIKLTKTDIEQFDEQLRKNYLAEKIQQLRAAKQKKLEEYFNAKGQSVPEHLKVTRQPPTLDYRQLRNELKQKNAMQTRINTKPKAPKTNTSIPVPDRYKKNYTPNISGKVDYKQHKLPVIKADVAIQPAQVSEPIIRNRTTYSEPLKVSGPNIINPIRDMKKCGATLKKMIGYFKKVDPKTKLPGILLDKKVK